MIFVDSHCHLPTLRHKNELEKILGEAKEAGVEKLVNIGTSLKENAEALDVAENYSSVYASVGVYPHEHRADNIQEIIGRMEIQARSSKKVVAIGECGIDITNWKNQRPLAEQIALFETQVNLAQKLNLPLIVHNRNGDEVILQILSRYYNTESIVTGVIHCFDSGWEVTQNFLNLGFYISFSGFVTYDTHRQLEEVVQKIPSDKYLLETDSPFILPEPVRSETSAKTKLQKNEPRYVRMVGQKVAQLRQESLDAVAQTTTQNAHALFGI